MPVYATSTLTFQLNHECYSKVKSNVIKCNLPLVMQIVIEKKKVHITI